MSDARTKALNTVRYLKLAEPAIARLTEERTLNVAGDTPEFDTWPATLIARTCLRAALENGCTRIQVHQGVHRKWKFDVMDLVKATRYMTGGVLNAPSESLPEFYATQSLLSLGATLDRARIQVAVSTAVSGKTPAAKE